MSTGLMSCVRENSPPLEMTGSESGSVSLPLSNNTSEQTKRRRFHPLRNLRRMFRRRTLTSPVSGGNDASSSTTSQSNTTTPVHQTSSVLLDRTIPNLTLSSPSSPATSASSPYLLMKTPTTTNTSPPTIVPALSYSSAPNNIDIQMSTAPYMLGISRVAISGRKSPSGGIQVMPSSLPISVSNPNSGLGNFYIKQSKQSDNGSSNELSFNKDGSTQDLDQEDLDSRSGEMTDSQRSFSEGRLVDSDFNRDPLSQSHDSVFSESATASSLSIVLKNELFDVLRKRRNRPDASDEDLGLPHSPTTPQRKDRMTSNMVNNPQNQSEVSSLSLLSMNSSDMDDEVLSSTQNDATGDRTESSLSSSKITSSLETSRTSDETDFSISGGSSGGGRLSHSAARHKMAVRPKKKGPTRHKRPIEPTILPSTPEVNEDLVKHTLLLDVKDLSDKVKSRSLPPGVNSSIIKQQSDSQIKKSMTNIKRSKTEKGTSSSSVYTPHTVIKSSTYEKDLTSHSITSSHKDEDSGFFKRFLHRNSKGKGSNSDDKKFNSVDSIKSGLLNDDEIYTSKTTISKSTQKENTVHEYSQRVEETRKEIRREILSEANSGLSIMLNNFIISTDESNSDSVENFTDQEIDQSPSKPAINSNKPKSGPAARQRIMPKDLTNSPFPDYKNSSEKLSLSEFNTKELRNPQQCFSECLDGSGIETPRSILKVSNECVNASSNMLTTSSRPVEIAKLSLKSQSKSSTEELCKSSTEEIFKSHTSIKNTEEIGIPVVVQHFEKRTHPKIVGLSPFQQKISRNETTFDNSDIIPKQRKSVEKSKSFRSYTETKDGFVTDPKLKKCENMPSLPDLSFSRNSSEDLDYAEETSVSLGFEINDNNLMNSSDSYICHENNFALSQGIFTKNIILTTSKPKTTKNITEIEENIDKLLVKSPPQFVSMMRKSNSMGESIEKKPINISISPMENSGSFVKSSSQEIKAFEKFEEMKSHTSITPIHCEPMKILPKNSINTNNLLKYSEQRKSFTETTKLNESLIAYKLDESLMSKSMDSSFDKSFSSNQSDIKANVPINIFSEPVPYIKDDPKLECKSGFSYNSSYDQKKKNKTDSNSKLRSHIKNDYKNGSQAQPEQLKCKGVSKIEAEAKGLVKPRVNISVSEKSAVDKGIPEFMKIQLNRVIEPCRSKSNLVLSKNAKSHYQESKCISDENIETFVTTDTKPPLPPLPLDLEKKRNSFIPSSQDPKSPVRKFNEDEEVILRNTEYSQISPLFERRKSVNDEKLKYEKKIEELKAERQNSLESRKSSIDDDSNINLTGSVVLRKKSFIFTTQLTETKKDDPTPELMKVFARRSLKIKDEDLQSFEEIAAYDNNKAVKNFIGSNLDSDKENQSSSEEKLDKLTKNEQQNQSNNGKTGTIVGNNQKHLPNQKSFEDNTRNSSLDIRKTNSATSIMNNNAISTNNNFLNNNNSLNATPTKSFNRYSTNNNTNNQRNSTTPERHSTITNKNSTNLRENEITITTNNGNITENNNNLNCTNASSSNSFTKKGTRHTIGPAVVQQNQNDEIEFKGILQRRAEWEKRAKEAAK